MSTPFVNVLDVLLPGEVELQHSLKLKTLKVLWLKLMSEVTSREMFVRDEFVIEFSEEEERIRSQTLDILRKKLRLVNTDLLKMVN